MKCNKFIQISCIFSNSFEIFSANSNPKRKVLISKFMNLNERKWPLIMGRVCVRWLIAYCKTYHSQNLFKVFYQKKRESGFECKRLLFFIIEFEIK